MKGLKSILLRKETQGILESTFFGGNYYCWLLILKEPIAQFRPDEILSKTFDRSNDSTAIPFEVDLYVDGNAGDVVGG